MAKKQGNGGFRTSIGGQALIEGILMRGPERQAIVVRSKEGLVTKVDELKLTPDRYPILKLPVLRGVVMFISSMVNGIRALMFSADYFPDEELGEPGWLDRWLEKHVPAEKLQNAIAVLSVLLSLGLSLVLFMLLPTFLAGLADPYLHSAVAHNLIEGVIKIAILMAYMILVSKQRDVARVFQYHGAEHKTIFCYEAGLELTVENTRAQPMHHPRCGTSFLLVVVVVSILFSGLALSYMDWRSLWIRVAVHLALLIPVIGVTYEFNRAVGRHDNALTRVLSAPGLWLQNFTTNEPDDSMLEVAIEALRLVMPEEKGKDSW